MLKLRILVTGASGLLGYALTSLLKNEFEILKPNRSQLNLLNLQTIQNYLYNYKPQYILHCAAFVDAAKAELERGELNGLTYQTNVVGTKNIIEAAKKNDAKVIYISTGSVFHGDIHNPGPFTEFDTPVKNSNQNNWYGYTKYLGETMQPEVILRISHPLIAGEHRIKNDYLQKIINAYDSNMLYPLFNDQMFSLTSAEDLAKAIKVIILQNKKGIYHVTSKDLVSPFELTKYALAELGKPLLSPLIELSIDKFYKEGNSSLRFAKYCAITSDITESALELKFKSWQKIVQEALT